MGFNPKRSRFVVGWRRVRYKVKIVGDPCERDTKEGIAAQSLLLEDIRSHPDLMNCGPTATGQLLRWQILTIKYNGEAWEAEAAAEVEEDTEVS